MKKIFSFLFFIILNFVLYAQAPLNCQQVEPYLKAIEERIRNINTTDPEVITLHYLFTKDIENELSDFYTLTIPQLSNCPDLNFYKIIDQYDWCKQTNLILRDSLAIQKNLVNLIFYQSSYIEFNLGDYDEALYLVDRSLQFKDLQADPLLLKLEILFRLKRYQESIDVLNTIYYDSFLNEEQEKKTINFNLKFYEHLYHIGDSLITIDKATDAFKIFKLLETFCNNMPSGYCNDDYYHGLLKSKVGVYDSYIKIANVAKERGNSEMEKKFLQYAEEYLNANQDILFEMALTDKSKETTPVVETKTQIKTNTYQPNSVDSVLTIKKPPIVKTTTETNPKNSKIEINRTNVVDSIGILYGSYQKLISEAIDLCIQQEFDAAYDKFISAQELEQCDCFLKDARIGLFLNELRKIQKN